MKTLIPTIPTVKALGESAPRARTNEFINLAKAAGLFWKDGLWHTKNNNSNNKSSPISSFKDRKIDYSVLQKTFITNPVEFDESGHVKPISLNNSNKGVGRGSGRRKNSKEIIFPSKPWTVKGVALSNNIKTSDVANELTRLRKSGETTEIVGYEDKKAGVRGKKTQILMFKSAIITPVPAKIKTNKVSAPKPTKLKSKPKKIDKFAKYRKVVKITSKNIKRKK